MFQQAFVYSEQIFRDFKIFILFSIHHWQKGFTEFENTGLMGGITSSLAYIVGYETDTEALKPDRGQRKR